MLFAADDALNAGNDFRDSEQTDQSGDELEAIQQAGLLDVYKRQGQGHPQQKGSFVQQEQSGDSD